MEQDNGITADGSSFKGWFSLILRLFGITGNQKVLLKESLQPDPTSEIPFDTSDAPEGTFKQNSNILFHKSHNEA